MQQIKSKCLTLIISGLLTVSSTPTFSAGIPTFDAAAVAKMVSQISMLTQQFNELQQHTNQLEQQIANTTGGRGMGTSFNDLALMPGLPNDWNDVLNQIKSSSLYTVLRAEYPTSAEPSINNYYDQLASEAALVSSFYEKTNKRIGQIQSLRTLIDTASDPAAKMDLQNRIAIENTVVDATTQLINLMNEKHNHDLEQVSKLRRKAKTCKEFKKTTC